MPVREWARSANLFSIVLLYKCRGRLDNAILRFDAASKLLLIVLYNIMLGKEKCDDWINDICNYLK